jgi:hypothetical protein
MDSHIPQKLLDRVSQEFTDLIGDDAQCRDLGEGVASAHRYLENPNQKIADLHRLLTDEVAATIRTHYRSNFRVRSIRAYRNEALPQVAAESDVFGNLWHLDPELVCDLRYFVYLSPIVTAEQGALEIMGANAARLVTRTGYIGRSQVTGLARRYLANPSRGTPMEGVRGTSVLIDTQRCLHRAGIPAPGQHRDVVQFWITPAPEPMPADWGTSVVDPVWSSSAPVAPGAG